jgi:hypothetical protein
MTSRPASDRAQFNGASYFRLGEGAQAAVKDGFFFLDVGGAAPQTPAEEPKGRGKRKGKSKTSQPKQRQISVAEMGPLGEVLQPGSTTLGKDLYAAGLRGFDVMGQQDLWVDFAGIAKAIEHAGSEQGGVAGQAARLFAERASALRDALFETRPQQGRQRHGRGPVGPVSHAQERRQITQWAHSKSFAGRCSRARPRS